MTAAKKLQLLTVEEYLERELHSKVKHEYCAGQVYAMAGRTSVHNMISAAIVALMYTTLRGHRCQAFNSNTKVRMRMATHTSFYYPDGMVVCESNRPEETFQDRPVVLAEVISASTRRIDEGEKRDAYLTIPELSAYLLIESTSPRVVVYHRTDSGFERVHYEGLDAVIRSMSSSRIFRFANCTSGRIFRSWRMNTTIRNEHPHRPSPEFGDGEH